MKRSDFLKVMGFVGLGSMLPGGKARTHPGKLNDASLYEGVDCVLIPQETAGPYPLDLSKNNSMFRQDITEGRPGTPLKVVFTVVNINDNCNPVPNARVDIWQCDKDGVYSGYSQPGANTVGQTFMRGIQMTDSEGRVEFYTVYPGWYSGRITHIHFQVFMNSVLSATSQAAFPDSLNKEVYATPLYSSHGQNSSVANNAADMVFSSPASALQYELLTIAPNSATGGYDSSLTIGISAPKAGIVELEPETGGQFKLQQNFPNPFKNKTTITFSLIQASHVALAIFDVRGSEVVRLVNARMDAGEHNVDWNRMASGSPVGAGNYLFQLTINNGAGQFRQCKVMTVH